MVSLSDNERAMRELLAETPRSLIPPIHLSYARRLWRQGLAVCANDGQWYITAAGVRETQRHVH